MLFFHVISLISYPNLDYKIKDEIILKTVFDIYL